MQVFGSYVGIMLIGAVESLQSQFEVKGSCMCFVKQIASQLAAVWKKNHLV